MRDCTCHSRHVREYARRHNNHGVDSLTLLSHTFEMSKCHDDVTKYIIYGITRIFNVVQ